MIRLATVHSPVGPLAVAARQDRICLLHFGGVDDSVRRVLANWYSTEEVVASLNPGGAADLLDRYFAGDLTALDAIEVELNGTPFQQRVWQALRSVRAGSTASYAEIARGIGAPSAVRAVGAANGANPVAIVVPCHRIIGSNGRLTGYGGGLDRKEWLLRHEGVRQTSLFADWRTPDLKVGPTACRWS